MPLGKDGCWYDDWNSMIKANARYEQGQKQIQELQRANSLEIQRMREEKQNAERIAEATRKAELDRHENEIKIEKMRHEHEQIMRYHKLCDDLRMNYDDIIAFANLLDDISPQKVKEYSQLHKEYSKLLVSDEINKIKDKNKEMYGKVLLLKKQNKKELLKTLEDTINISFEGIKRNKAPLSGNLKQIKEYIANDEKEILAYKSGMWFISPIIVLLSLIGGSFIFLIIGIVFGIYSGIRLLKIKKDLKLMKNKINDTISKCNKLIDDEFANKIDDLETKIKENDEKITLKNNKGVEELEKNANYQDFLKKYNEAKNNLISNRKVFYDFRIEHYNRDVEMLFKKVGLEIEKIDKENIIKEGTVEDYQMFIENIISENTGNISTNIENDFDDIEIDFDDVEEDNSLTLNIIDELQDITNKIIEKYNKKS